MSQTVKISASFRDKVSENYNSSEYGLSLELDVAVNGTTNEIEDASQKLFALTRRLVLAQRSVNVDTLLNHETPQPTPTPAPAVPKAPQQPTAGNNNSTPSRLATQKQIKFLLELAKKAKLTHDEILSMPTIYHKEKFEQLSASEASSLIDRFNTKKAA